MIELSYDPECGWLPSNETLDLMRLAANSTFAEAGVSNMFSSSGRAGDKADAEISLSFVSPEAMRSLNNRYRAIDDVTDVLSFPQLEPAVGGGLLPPAAERSPLLGDIVICTERARDQAEEYGHGETRELVYLFVHGMLHLLGYDHAADGEKGAMRVREEEIMQALGLSR
jgi:probable rRNA maturation factor